MANNDTPEVIIKVGADTSQLNQAIGTATQAVTNLGNTPISTTSFQNFKQAIREANNEAQKLEQQFGRNSTQFVEAAKRVAELKDKFQEYKQAVDSFNPDNKLQSLVTVARGATTALQGVSGAMAFLGGESQKNEEIIRRLNGLMAFSNALNGIDDLKNGFRNIAAVLGITKDAAIATTVGVQGLTVATEAETVATEGATIAAEGFSTALKSIGIGLLIGAVILLITQWDNLKNAISGAKDATIDYDAVNAKAAQNYVTERQKVADLVTEAQNENTTKERKKELIKELNDASPNYFNGIKTEKDLTEKLTDATDKYNKALLLQAQIKAAQTVSQKDTENLVQAQIERQQKLASSQADYDKTLKAGGSVGLTQAAYNGTVVTDITMYRKLINDDYDKKEKELTEKLKPYQDFIQQKSNELIKLGGSPTDTKKPDTVKVDNSANEFEKQLQSYLDKVGAMYSAANRIIVKENLNARDAELAVLEAARQDKLAELNKTTNDEIKALEAAKKKKTITAKQYEADLLKIGSESFKAREAINEASNQSILETNQKYDKVINDYLTQSLNKELDTYTKKKKEINDKIDELLKTANPEQAAGLESLRTKQLGQVDNERGLQSISELANDNLVNTQNSNVIGEKDRPKVVYDKTMAINDAKIAAEQASFELQKAQLEGNNAELAKLQQSHNEKIISLNKERAEANKKLDDAEKEAKYKNYEAVGKAASALGDLLGEQTVAGKGLAIASATINTYVGASKALSEGGPILGPIEAVAITLAGLAQVKKIIDVKVPAKASSAGIATPTLPAAPAISATAAQPVTTQDVRVTNNTDTTVRAYITQKDLTTNEERNNFLNKYSSF